MWPYLFALLLSALFWECIKCHMVTKGEQDSHLVSRWIPHMTSATTHRPRLQRLCCWGDPNRCLSLGIPECRHRAKDSRTTSVLRRARNKGVTEVMGRRRESIKGVLSPKPQWANGSQPSRATWKKDVKHTPQNHPCLQVKELDLVLIPPHLSIIG